MIVNEESRTLMCDFMSVTDYLGTESDEFKEINPSADELFDVEAALDA